MTTKLTMPCLVIGLGLLGCAAGEERPSNAGGTGGALPGATGGTSRTGGAQAPNADSAVAGAGSGGQIAPGTTGGASSTGGAASGSRDAAAAAASDAAAPVSSAGDGGVNWAKCGATSFIPNVSAAEFCAKYMEICMFDPAGGAGGKSRFKSLSDCMMKYSTLSDGERGGKACVTWHLCIAGQDDPNVYCPHAPEAAAMSGPCKASYL